jgi:type II secretory pathway component PulF
MRCGFCYVCDFIVSSVIPSTRGLESSLNVALDSVGRFVLGWVDFISDWVFFSCVRREWLFGYASYALITLVAHSGTVARLLFMH